MRLLLFAFIVVVASCMLCCKATNNIAYITDDIYLNITLAPTADTSNTVTLASYSTEYRVDSFLKSRTGNEYSIASLSALNLKSADLTLLNATPTNNFGNLSRFNLGCITNINTQEVFASKYSVPDSFATTINDIYVPRETVNYYLRSGKNSDPTSVQFTYSARCKLRRPLTDSLKCIFHLNYEITLYKK